MCVAQEVYTIKFPRSEYNLFPPRLESKHDNGIHNRTTSTVGYLDLDSLRFTTVYKLLHAVAEVIIKLAQIIPFD